MGLLSMKDEARPLWMWIVVRRDVTVVGIGEDVSISIGYGSCGCRSYRCAFYLSACSGE